MSRRDDMRSRKIAVLLWICAGAWAPPPARANPLDVFGAGGRGPALASAVATLADDASAAYYNPAGLALAERPSILVGYSAGVPRLTFDGTAAPSEAARGITLGIVLPREVAGTTLSFGAALYFPDQRIVRVHTAPAWEPRFAQYDNRLQRIAIHPDFDVGINLDRARDPAAQRGSASLDVQLPTRIAPVLGVWVEPLPKLRASLVYRGSISLDVAVDTRVAIDATLLRGRALTGLSSADYWSPDQLTLGLAYDPLPQLTVTLEATWQRWSAAPSPLPAVRALLDLGLSIDVVQVSIPSEAFQPYDVVVPRLGVEGRLQPKRWLGIDLRGGLSFEPTPYPRQTGATSLADNDKLVLAAGVGLVFKDLGELVKGPLRVDAYFQAHLLRERFHPKEDPLGPTPSFRSAGALFAAGLMMGLGF